MIVQGGFFAINNYNEYGESQNRLCETGQKLLRMDQGKRADQLLRGEATRDMNTTIGHILRS